MASPTSQNESAGKRNNFSRYFDYLWNRPSYLRNCPPHFRSRNRWECFPLLLPSTSHSPLAMIEPSRIHDVLGGIFEHVLRNLHSIEQNLHFWEYKEEGSDTEKARFLIFERGPRAFIYETVHLLRGCKARGSSIQQLNQSASLYINERIVVLSALRYSLATFLTQVYLEVYKIEESVKDPAKKLPSLLSAINDSFTTLEASIGHLHATLLSNSPVAFPLLFEKLPGINHEGYLYTDCAITDAVNSVHRNLDKLDGYISTLVTKFRKPRKITQCWIRYSCGALGLSICSIWLLQRSRLMGLSDVHNWIPKAKDSMTNFYTERVEQPHLSIGDELFETFRKRHEGIMEQEEAQLTSNSLHRYEKEQRHPTQSVFSRELAQALLIQVQKLKLDIEMATLELNQKLWANEINLAILTALPALSLSLSLFMAVRAWFKQEAYMMDINLTPRLDLEFNDIEEAYEFWKSYGRSTGFGVRKQSFNKSKKDKSKYSSYLYVCSKEGVRKPDIRDVKTKKPRDETRTGCKARMRVKLVKGKYKISEVFLDHNHPLQPPEAVHLFASYRGLSSTQCYELENAEKVGISKISAFNLQSQYAGGRTNLGYTRSDVKNYLN